MRDELLFNTGRLSDALSAQLRRLFNEIDSAPEDHVLHADDDAWVAALVERYRVTAPVLRTDRIWQERPQEVEVDVSWDRSRYFSDPTRPALVAGTRFIVHIPFDGDQTVFRLQPNSFDFNPPRAALRSAELVHTIEFPNDSPREIQPILDDLLQRVEKYLGWARADIEAFNAGLDGQARSRIASRRQRIRESYERAAASGIPIGPRGETPKTYIADAIVRRPSPVSPRVRTERPIRLEPALSDEIFEHILGIVRAACMQMERAPKTYAGMNEEARRDVILTSLNTHYVGQGMAEAFNVGGKTDVLVRVDDRNVFIGECKFWAGVKELGRAIDQLFSYAAWRDTKLALVVFVRERKLTDIVAKAATALHSHPRFIAAKPAAGETELRATMSWPGDEERLADLNVFLVHTPEGS